MNKVPATFTYNGKTYKHITPVKRLMQSTMVYDVILRGDVFGMDVDTQEFTIIPRDKIEAITLADEIKQSVEHLATKKDDIPDCVLGSRKHVALPGSKPLKCIRCGTDLTAYVIKLA